MTETLSKGRIPEELPVYCSNMVSSWVKEGIRNPQKKKKKMEKKKKTPRTKQNFNFLLYIDTEFK